MTDIQNIADRYIAAWNAPDPASRRELLNRHWADDATYVDPLARGSGLDEIDALIAGAQRQFPGFTFQLKGPADGHGDHVRFSWTLGPAGAAAPIEGSDVVTIRDGRIAEVIGFLDKFP